MSRGLPDPLHPPAHEPEERRHRRHLQQHEGERRREAGDPPATPTEAALAHLWATTLNITGPIGRHDNFFHLGGHSLLATQLAHHIDTTFTTQLPLRTLFDHPTLSELATAIEAAVLADVEAMTDDETRTLLAGEPEVDS